MTAVKKLSFDQLLVNEMSSAQATADAYAAVTESRVRVHGHNRLRFLVEETGGSNGITAKVRGRYLRENGYSSWQDVSAEVAISAGSSAEFDLGPHLKYDEYEVWVKSTSASSPGAVQVYGGSRYNPYSEDREPTLSVTRSIGSETGDALTVSHQFSRRESLQIHAKVYAGAQTSAGDLAQDGTACTISDGTDGSTLLGDDTAEAVFLTSATGALDIECTDTAGASSKEFIVVLREGGPDGRIIDIYVISFDGS